MTSSVPVDTPELNYFPNRSQLALYNEHLRMEKLNAKRRVQVPKDRSNASPLLRPKRPMLHDTSTSQARPDKQVRITIDDDESNDDDGDIQGDGETTKVSIYVSRLGHSRYSQPPAAVLLPSPTGAVTPIRVSTETILGAIKTGSFRTGLPGTTEVFTT